MQDSQNINVVYLTSLIHLKINLLIIIESFPNVPLPNIN